MFFPDRPRLLFCFAFLTIDAAAMAQSPGKKPRNDKITEAQSTQIGEQILFLNFAIGHHFMRPAQNPSFDIATQIDFSIASAISQS
ncbi:MAG: hypothetical protein H7A33_06585 [Deltaproteobacteria bacterium]|nr:hypothetical protein [Deltaproteobacteria bacterium]